jgi:ureidoacrylate peracid hydrolase
MRILKTPQERWQPGAAALLVVDVQNDFCSPRGASGQRGDNLMMVQSMIPRLLRFIERARAVALPIVYVRTTHSEWTDSPSWLYRQSQQKALTSCREGSWGAEFYEGIDPLPTERVVIKHRYSAFIRTDLDTVLRARGVESVLVTGVATNVCVETTARDAYMLDYYVTLVEDCCAGFEPALHQSTCENIRRAFGLVARSDEIAATWRD